jgi:hypothetical protein
MTTQAPPLLRSRDTFGGTENNLGDIKHWVRHHNFTFKMKQIMQLHEQSMAVISNMEWGIMSSHSECRTIFIEM